MNINKTKVVYFSGTGTTEKYAKALERTLPGDIETVALDTSTTVDDSMGADDLLVLALPVYQKFVPPFAWDCLANLKGSNTPAIVIATYGARNPDNALFEMKNQLAAKGFVVIGGAALVARHSMITTFAADRPNAEDLETVHQFGQNISILLQNTDSVADLPEVKFYGEQGGGPDGGVIPVVTDDCTLCGMCANECPAAAIPDDAPNTTDPEVCISCMRCIEVCPFDARCLPEAIQVMVSDLLEKTGDEAKPNQFFLA